MIVELPDTLTVDRFDTPLGRMYAVSDERGALRALAWTDHEARGMRQLQQQYGPRVSFKEGLMPTVIRRSLDDYFAGDMGALDRIECATHGTEFQQEVWWALRTIPVGQTLSYAKLAERIRRPGAVRAVGLANGANPVSIVLPCHRVIGADGSLTGYGGGLDRKRWLLAHEGARGVAGSATASLF